MGKVAWGAMFRSDRLPLHPLVLTAVYLIAAAGPIFLASGLAAPDLVFALMLFAGFLQVTWILHVGRYAISRMEKHAGVDERLRRRTRLMFGAASGIAISIFLAVIVCWLFLTPNPQTGAYDNPWVMPIVLGIFASGFTLIFQAAKALCEAESKNTGERIFVTVLRFFYIVIGAPFIYRRLKRLPA